MEPLDHGLMTMGRNHPCQHQRKYPDELRRRAVRLYRESEPKPVIRRLAEQLGVHHEALRNWIRQDEADHGERVDRPSTDVVAENRRLLREDTGLRRVHQMPEGPGAAFFLERR